MATSYEIKKVRLMDDGLKLSYYEHIDSGDDIITSKIDKYVKAFPHKDFMLIWRKLRYYLALLTETASPKSTEDKGLERFSILGVTISGHEEKEGFTIYGTKRIGSKKLNLSTPFRLFQLDPDNFNKQDQLNDLIEEVMTETELYLEGKITEVQTELNL